MRLVVAVIRNAELNAVKGLREGIHHVEDDRLVVVLFQCREIQIGRKASLAADDHFAQAGAALERESIQHAALREKLKQERQYNFLLRDHDVAKAGFSGIALHLRSRKHSYVSFLTVRRRPSPALPCSSSGVTLTKRRHVSS